MRSVILWILLLANLAAYESSNANEERSGKDGAVLSSVRKIRERIERINTQVNNRRLERVHSRPSRNEICYGE
ncbi:hypothetical protein C0J52_01902 [Blattella germanica]|nr:hypothetical protein C0J52_01902 [Blattella germanica]